VSVIIGEAPLSGPYPPAGWKPQGAQLKLPMEYGPPSAKLSNEYGPPKSEEKYDVEIEKQELEQLVETTTLSQVSNEYLPPANEIPSASEDDFLKVQGLPRSNLPPQFQQFPFSQPQIARIQQIQLPFLLTGEFAPLRNQQNLARFEQQRNPEAETETVNDYRPQQLPVHGPPANSYGPPTDSEVSRTLIYEIFRIYNVFVGSQF
jgi:hypothetical protein